MNKFEMDFSSFINAHKRNRFSYSPLYSLASSSLVDRMAPNDATTWIKIERNTLRPQICIQMYSMHTYYVSQEDGKNWFLLFCLSQFIRLIRLFARSRVRSILLDSRWNTKHAHIRLMSDRITIDRAHYYYYPCVRYARFQVLRGDIRRGIVFRNSFAHGWRMTVKLEHQAEPTNDDTIFVSIRWFQW